MNTEVLNEIGMCLAQFSQYECMSAYRVLVGMNDEETFPSLRTSPLIVQSIRSDIQLVFPLLA